MKGCPDCDEREWSLVGCGKIVEMMKERGFKCLAYCRGDDFAEGEEQMEVTRENLIEAATVCDEMEFVFFNELMSFTDGWAGAMLVIATNGGEDEWCADYTVGPLSDVMAEAIEEVMGT